MDSKDKQGEAYCCSVEQGHAGDLWNVTYGRSPDDCTEMCSHHIGEVLAQDGVTQVTLTQIR